MTAPPIGRVDWPDVLSELDGAVLEEIVVFQPWLPR